MWLFCSPYPQKALGLQWQRESSRSRAGACLATDTLSSDVWPCRWTKYLLIVLLKSKDELSLCIMKDYHDPPRKRAVHSGAEVWFHGMGIMRVNFGITGYSMNLHLLLSNFNIFHHWYKARYNCYKKQLLILDMSPSLFHSSSLSESSIIYGSWGS